MPLLQHALYQIWDIANKENADEMDLIHYAKVGGMPHEELPKEDDEEFEKWYSTLPGFKRAIFFLNPSLENVLNTHANELYGTAHNYYNEHIDDNEPISKEQAQQIIKNTFTCFQFCGHTPNLSSVSL